MRKKKKINKLVIVLIVLILIILFYIIFPVLKNNKYENNIQKEIQENYEINDKINYLNKFDLYYIIVTTNNLIVLDNKYQELLKEDIKNIKQIDTKYEIVYRLNKVMYETKEISKDKITYNYYDVYTNELIDTIEVGG